MLQAQGIKIEFFILHILRVSRYACHSSSALGRLPFLTLIDEDVSNGRSICSSTGLTDSLSSFLHLASTDKEFTRWDKQTYL